MEIGDGGVSLAEACEAIAGFLPRGSLALWELR